MLASEKLGTRLSTQRPIRALHLHGQGQAREAMSNSLSSVVTFPHARIHITYEIDYTLRDLIRKRHGTSHRTCVPDQSGPTYRSKQRLLLLVAPRAALVDRVRALLAFVASQTTVPSVLEHAIRRWHVSRDCILCARSQGRSTRNRGLRRVLFLAIKCLRSHGVVF
jgi:hypothetical protein